MTRNTKKKKWSSVRCCLEGLRLCQEGFWRVSYGVRKVSDCVRKVHIVSETIITLITHLIRIFLQARTKKVQKFKQIGTIMF